MTDTSEVENSYCSYCRKLLKETNEIQRGYHKACYLEVENYEKDREGQYWYYLELINASFDDISCDSNGEITAIDLSRKGMSFIPELEDISTFLKVEEFNVSQNYLTRVPSWFYRLPNLKRVIFPGNGFSQSLLMDILRLGSKSGTEVVSTGCVFRNNQLIKLNLSFINATTVLSFPEEITQFFSSLEYVFLRWNRLTRMPTWLYDLKHINELNLHTNRLNSQSSLDNFQATHIKKINLANNNLTFVPEWVLKQKELVELDLSNNQIQEFPNELFKMKKLRKIILSSTYIPPAILQAIIPKFEAQRVKVEFAIYDDNLWWLQ